ncbi:blastula protease 10-like [Branchiostoma floridae x Branchiostoma japonicum]
MVKVIAWNLEIQAGRKQAVIVNGNSCFSKVGVQGGEQEVSFGNGCIHKGIMMHELMHAVGFWHEQSRSDRDYWVDIIWDNVQDGKEHNFIKYSQTEVDTLGAPYDYGSLMHYSATSFSKNSLPTVVNRIPTDEVMGQRGGFSTTDVQKINQLYSCHMPVGWSAWSAWGPCDHTCTKTRQRFCSHPRGCSGHDTETQNCPWPCLVGVHPDCGSSFLGGPIGEIKSPMYPQNYPNFVNCKWLINATGTEPITISFNAFSLEESFFGCVYDFVKVYDGADERAPLLGTYCGETNPPDLTSSGDQMFITFSSDSSRNETGFFIEYSSVQMLADCDFDTDMCNFFQDGSDNFDWTRHQGSTPS